MISEANYRELQKYLNPYSPKPEEKERFTMLRDNKYIAIHSHKTISVPGFGSMLAPDTWLITGTGKDALAEFEQEHNKETERKRQQRFQNKVSVLNVLVPLITFFLGLIVEYYAGLISWVSSLFHIS